MKQLFLIKTFVNEEKTKEQELSITHSCLENTPYYITYLYELLTKSILEDENISKSFYEKDLFGFYYDVDDNFEINDNDDFFEVLNKCVKHNNKTFDLEFIIAINSDVTNLTSTIEKIITLIVTAFQLEVQEINKKISNKV